MLYNPRTLETMAYLYEVMTFRLTPIVIAAINL